MAKLNSSELDHIRGGNPILTEADFTVDFDTLEERAKALASYLLRHGIGRGDPIAILVPMSIQLYECLLSVMGIGAAAVFVQTVSGISSIVGQLRDAEPKVILTTRAIRRVLNVSGTFRALKVICVDTIAAIASNEIPLPIDGIPGETPAYISYTTGSTGEPKRIVKSYDFLKVQSKVLSRHLNIKPGHVEIVSLPAFVMNSIMAGAHSIVPATRGKVVRRWDHSGIARQILHYGVTRCTASPGFLVQLAKWAKRRRTTFDGIKEIYTGGAPIGIEWFRSVRRAFPAASVYLLYGSTEAEPISTINGDIIERHIADTVASGGGYCVGKPVDEVKVRIDPSIGDFESGEVVVSGNHVNTPEGEWLSTSDVGYFDDSGNLWLTGRTNNLFVRSGRQVEPYRTEAAVAAFPGVGRTALVPIKSRRGGLSTSLAVSVEKRTRRHAVRKKIYEFCSVHGFPVDAVVFVRHMPVDKRHLYKINYKKLSNSLLFRIKTLLVSRT